MLPVVESGLKIATYKLALFVGFDAIGVVLKAANSGDVLVMVVLKA